MKKILLGFGFIFLMIAGILIFRPSSILSKADAKATYSLPNSKFLTWRGGEVHYVDEGKGFPILMIHGLAGSHRNFGSIAALMKDKYRVIRIDLPGFGLSDMPGMSDKDYRKLYIDFFDFFFESLQLDSFYLMGNSMGGWMAWELAAAYPEKVKQLTLLSSAGYDMQEIAEKLSGSMKYSSQIAEVVTAKGVPYFLTKRNIEKCFADPSTVNPDEVKVANALTNRVGNFNTILELLRERKDADTMLIQMIQCPTLIVYGKEDKIIPYTHAYRFERDVPNNRMFVYENCGHIPQVEKAERLRDDLLQFLKDSGLN